MKMIIVADEQLRKAVAVAASDLALEQVTADDPEEVAERTRTFECCIVLLQASVLGAGGPGLFRELKRQNGQEGRSCYIIAGSDGRDIDEQWRAADAGADDFVSADMSPAEMRSRLSLAVRVAGLEKKLMDLNNRLRLLVRTDSLTGLLNHAAILRELSMELDRAGRDGSPTSILMVDLDRFKLINDNLGHQTGDRVLVTFANLLCRSCRSFDRIGRYGGEEFLVVLPRTTGEEAASIAEMIRSGTEVLHLEEGASPLKLTCSIGCSTAEGSDRHPSSMIATVDSALFRAKESGRNSVVSFR
ncbi:MAG: hypothetical protein AVO35_00795 [Candidatus Aegiribacteria sp. MLS_C]|nr:MAG: hypothetical protein AVO35_00795 [Candidatus Aegiribacteria sp. MLS_C]